MQPRIKPGRYTAALAILDPLGPVSPLSASTGTPTPLAAENWFFTTVQYIKTIAINTYGRLLQTLLPRKSVLRSPIIIKDGVCVQLEIREIMANLTENIPTAATAVT